MASEVRFLTWLKTRLLSGGRRLTVGHVGLMLKKEGRIWDAFCGPSAPLK